MELELLHSQSLTAPVHFCSRAMRQAEDRDEPGSGPLFLVVWLGVAICMVTMFRIYLKDILPTLDHHGRPAYWRAGSGQMEQLEQLEQYRRICVENGYSLIKYRLFMRSYRIALTLVLITFGVVAIAALRGQWGC